VWKAITYARGLFNCFSNYVSPVSTIVSQDAFDIQNDNHHHDGTMPGPYLGSTARPRVIAVDLHET
jgi:hypothetical protein